MDEIKECRGVDTVLIGKHVIIQFLDSALIENHKLIARLDKEIYDLAEAKDVETFERMSLLNELNKKKKTRRWLKKFYKTSEQ